MLSASLQLHFVLFPNPERLTSHNDHHWGDTFNAESIDKFVVFFWADP